MRYKLTGLLVAVLGSLVAGCAVVKPEEASPRTPTLNLLQEGQGITRLQALTNDPRTDQVFWTAPFYWGHVGGHAVIGRAGQLPQRLADQYQGLVNASWSTDGQRIALCVKTGTKVPEAPNSSLFGNEVDAVLVSEPGDTAYRTIASGMTCSGIWLSPHGEALLVRDVLSTTASRYTLYDLSSGTQKVIPLGQSSSVFTSGPMWSPDGHKIAFLIQRQSLVLHDLETNREVQVDTPTDTLIGWTADGQTVYAGVTDNLRALMISAYSPKGRATATASISFPPSLAGTPYIPRLSPDGKQVAFGLKGLTSQGICLADIQGGPSRQVVPPSSLLGWLDASTLLCEVLKDGNLQVDYTVDLTQR